MMWLTHINVICQELLTVVNCMAGTLLATLHVNYLSPPSPTHHPNLQSVKSSKIFHLAFWEYSHHMQNEQNCVREHFSFRKDYYLFACLSCVHYVWQIWIKHFGPGWDLQKVIIMQFITTTFSFMDESQNNPVGSGEALTRTEDTTYL